MLILKRLVGACIAIAALTAVVSLVLGFILLIGTVLPKVQDAGQYADRAYDLMSIGGEAAIMTMLLWFLFCLVPDSDEDKKGLEPAE